jgi:hypothetical protein
MLLASHPTATACFHADDKRGIDLGASSATWAGLLGLLRGDYLPNDRLRERDRWGFTAQHTQPGMGTPVLGPSSLNLNLNRVSATTTGGTSRAVPPP